MGMNNTPASERTHIGFFGRRNAGKSSIVNAVTGQELAVVSDVKGTTTDPVYKTMELLPLGPVMIIDTPGMRELGMWDTSEGLKDAFSDVEQFIGACRFSNSFPVLVPHRNQEDNSDHQEKTLSFCNFSCHIHG